MFTEDWYRPSGLAALERALDRTDGLSGRVIEIGCWEGRSTVTLARAAYPTTVHAVDTWLGSPGEISETLARERDVFARFLSNIDELTLGNVIAHRMDWRDYLAADQSPVRFIHIDGLHTFDEVKANIEAVLPMMVPGGVICGDDAHHQPIIDAVNATLGHLTLDVSLWWWQKETDGGN